jgi:hypothetical protein
MTNLLTKIIPHTELKAMFDSAETQEFLKKNTRRIKGKEPFLYRYESVDEPSVNLAAAYIFPGPDPVWIEFLILDDVQHIPQYPQN